VRKIPTRFSRLAGSCRPGWGRRSRARPIGRRRPAGPRRCGRPTCPDCRRNATWGADASVVPVGWWRDGESEGEFGSKGVAIEETEVAQRDVGVENSNDAPWEVHTRVAKHVRDFEDVQPRTTATPTSLLLKHGSAQRGRLWRRRCSRCASTARRRATRRRRRRLDHSGTPGVLADCKERAKVRVCSRRVAQFTASSNERKRRQHGDKRVLHTSFVPCSVRSALPRRDHSLPRDRLRPCSGGAASSVLAKRRLRRGGESAGAVGLCRG